LPQDYVKAREWFEKAAAGGDEIGMRDLGLLYVNGWGVPKDYVKAREWYEKAAAAGSTDAVKDLADLRWVPTRDAIANADAAGKYAEALRLQAGLADKLEADEVKTDGKPGTRTASTLNSVSWYALFAREFSRALSASERAHALAPDKRSYEANHAHALMFLGRLAKARTLYLTKPDELVPEMGNKPWRQVVADDFAELRKAGLANPLMDEIEAAWAAKVR
jgi:TPR repeat protein